MKCYLRYIVLLLLFTCYLGAKAGERVNIKLGYSNNRTAIANKSTISIKGEANVCFLTYFEVGFYLGFGGYMNIIEQTSNSVAVSYHSSNTYGFQTAIQVLPIFVKDSTLRVNCYLSGKLGGINVWNKNFKNTPDKYFSDWGIYIGASYYIGRNWGLYSEYGYGSFTRLRYGLVFRF